MRFWLDRGVDGFRIDVAHGMAKPDGLPDMVPMEDTGLLADHGPGDHRFDQDGVHACTGGSGRCSTSTPAPWPSARSGSSDDDRLAQYLRDRRAAAGVQLQAAHRRLGRRRAAAAVDHSLATVEGTPAPACWVLSNHDRPRHVTRYGGGELGHPAGAGGGPAAAGPARCGLRLQRRRARHARRRPARRGAAGPDLGALRAHRARPGRLPDPDAVVGHRAVLRVLDPARHLAAHARGLGRAHRGGAGGRPRFDAVAVPSGAGAAGASPAFGGEELEWLPAPEGCLAFRRPAGWSAWSTSPARRSRCRRGGCCWPAPTSAAGALPRRLGGLAARLSGPVRSGCGCRTAPVAFPAPRRALTPAPLSEENRCEDQGPRLHRALRRHHRRARPGRRASRSARSRSPRRRSGSCWPARSSAPGAASWPSCCSWRSSRSGCRCCPAAAAGWPSSPARRPAT